MTPPIAGPLPHGDKATWARLGRGVGLAQRTALVDVASSGGTAADDRDKASGHATAVPVQFRAIAWETGVCPLGPGRAPVAVPCATNDTKAAAWGRQPCRAGT